MSAMFAVARNATRVTARRSAFRARNYATEVVEQLPTAAESPYVAKLEAVEHHAAGAAELWRKISYFVCVPAITVCGVWVYQQETEHFAHLEHLKHDNGGVIPQPPEYEYLNRRVKPFPWGMNTLFFNKEVQRDMSVE